MTPTGPRDLYPNSEIVRSLAQGCVDGTGRSRSHSILVSATHRARSVRHKRTRRSDKLTDSWYGEPIIDRQINKARGILPFNSIVIAAFSFERTRLPNLLRILNVDINIMLLLTMALLAASSILCLLLMLVRFGPVADYESYSAEIASTVHIIKKRSGSPGDLHHTIVGRGDTWNRADRYHRVGSAHFLGFLEFVRASNPLGPCRNSRSSDSSGGWAIRSRGCAGSRPQQPAPLKWPDYADRIRLSLSQYRSQRARLGRGGSK